MATTAAIAQTDSLEIAKEWRIYHTEKIHQLPLWLSLALNIGLIIYIIYLQRKIKK